MHADATVRADDARRAARRRSDERGLDHHRRRDRRAAAAASAEAHRAPRVARRSARTGGVGGNGSGDIFIAFSTANAERRQDTGVAQVKMLSNARMNALFDATIQATEEAIVNAHGRRRDDDGRGRRPCTRCREIV